MAPPKTRPISEYKKKQIDDAEKIDSIGELWKNLSIKEKEFILVIPVYDTNADCVRAVLDNKKANYSGWLYAHRQNPYFKKAELIRKETPDQVVLELFEVDMRVEITRTVSRMVRDGKIPEKEIYSVMKRLASKVTGDEGNDKDEMDINNIVSFMPNG